MRYRIFCDPRPWPRTQGSGTRRYSPSWYRELKSTIRHQISLMGVVERFEKHFIRVYITVIVRCPKRKTRDYPPQGDVDNYAKAVLDALQREKGHPASMRYWLFDDDRFVQALYVTKEWSTEVERPGYKIEIERVYS